MTPKPRRLEFTHDSELPQHWMADNAFVTQFFTAFTAQFPVGERFLIRSVRAFRAQLDQDPALKAAVSGFIGQEAHHARAHEAFNEFLARRGLPTEAIDAQTAWAIALLQRLLTPRQQLAMTAGLEHFTSMFGDLVLRHPELLDDTAPGLRPLMLWHAWEETEHKAVAFDAYQAVAGHYGERVAMFLLVTVLLAAFSAISQLRLTVRQPESLRPRTLIGGLRWMFGRGDKAGYLRGMLPAWRDYLRRDFHPWQHDNRALLAQWQPQLEALEAHFS